ncbi:MAG: GxxExxY protein [Planctomycetota bacterium]|nr:GxxExxY protein [Planctomycetota bacterium]
MRCPSDKSLSRNSIPPEVDKASNEIIGAAIEVHRHLAPGFLESVYEKALVHEMRLMGLTVHQQVPIALLYKDLRIEGQRLDLLVEPGVIVELKTVDSILPIHEAQLISYLRTTGYRLGLLINFRCNLLKKGIKRIVY